VQSRRFVSYLESFTPEELLRSGARETALGAKALLGFPVTETNVRFAMRTVLGIRPPAKAWPSEQDKLDLCAAHIRAMQLRLDALEGGAAQHDETFARMHDDLKQLRAEIERMKVSSRDHDADVVNLRATLGILGRIAKARPGRLGVRASRD